jgi:hypothetical protein
LFQQLGSCREVLQGPLGVTHSAARLATALVGVRVTTDTTHAVQRKAAWVELCARAAFKSGTALRMELVVASTWGPVDTAHRAATGVGTSSVSGAARSFTMRVTHACRVQPQCLCLAATIYNTTHRTGMIVAERGHSYLGSMLMAAVKSFSAFLRSRRRARAVPRATRALSSRGLFSSSLLSSCSAASVWPLLICRQASRGHAQW